MYRKPADLFTVSATDLRADEQIWRWLVVPQDEFK